MPPALLLALALSRPAAAEGDPADVCAALLTERPRIAEAIDHIEKGADPNARCAEEYTAYRRRRLSLGEVIFGVLIPPVGALMLATNTPKAHDAVRYPTLLDLSVRLRSEPLAVALLDAGADPLLPVEKYKRVPLVVAVAKDVEQGGTTWTSLLLRDLEHVPADLLQAHRGLSDELLVRPDLLQLLLDKGLDPEGRDRDGGTWLLRAARAGRLDRAQAALGLGADPNLNHKGDTPLGLAVESGKLDLIEVLVEAGADPAAAAGSGSPLLSRAVDTRNRDVVDAVLALGAPVDGSDGRGPRPLSVAVERDLPDLIELLLSQGATLSEGDVCHAAQFGRNRSLRLLLDAGGDPNEVDWWGPTALALALKGDRLDTAQILLDAGADPMHRSPDTYRKPSAMAVVVEAGDMERFSLLLPYVPDRQRGKLVQLALIHDAVEMAEAAATEGVVLDEQLRLFGDDDGDRADRAWLREHGARWPADVLPDLVRWGDPGAIAEALGDGARVDAVDYSKRTVAELARDRNDIAVSRLLVDAGARLPDGYTYDPRQHGGVRGVDNAVLLGWTPSRRNIQDAVFFRDLELIEKYATLDTPVEIWKPRGLWRGELWDRVAEIHKAKKKAARDARKRG